jgi:PAS domain S-box-containing protein
MENATKILLVDDEPDVENLIKLKFRNQIRHGEYEFIFARNGVEALEKLQENSDINIVISDINMPEMDGLTLLNRIKNLKSTLKAIIISAYGDMDNIREAMNRGAYDFLTKPLDFNDLKITIEKTSNTVEEIKRNINTLKRAERSLEESIARNQAIINTAADTILTIDATGIVESINPAGERLFGYSQSEIIGRNISILMAEPDRSNHDNYIMDYLRKRNRSGMVKHSIEVNAMNSKGRIFPIELSVSEFQVGERTKFTGILRDISMRKKAELLLKEYNVTLEKEVGERTKELRKINEEKNEILALVAHDLKNPLSNIKMLARMLMETPDFSRNDIEEFSGDMLSQSERIFDLIQNLLDANALEKGKITLGPEKFQLSFITGAAIDNYREQASQKNIEIVAEQSDNVPNMVYADRSATMQIIDNLISNAIKYSPHGKKVYISISSSENEVFFRVRDEGPGISAEDQKNLFKKFSRLSAKPTGGEHSTGLGLSIVKKLIELMNGRVWCESRPEEGAEFIAAFPTAGPDYEE